MGAAAHLGIKPGEYDKTIATLIPHYKELIGAAAAAVDMVARAIPTVVDLGTGSGTLAERILEVRPKARLIGIDADPVNARHGDAPPARPDPDHRGQLRAGSHSPLRCGVGLVRPASHPDQPPQSRALQALLFVAPPGGMLVSADCYLASSTIVQKHDREAWLSHLQRAYTRRKAQQFLKTWAKEDVYFTLDREIEIVEGRRLRG